MSRRRDCGRCGEPDLMPEMCFHTNLGTICRACAVEDMWMVAEALGMSGGFAWDEHGMTLTWDDMHVLLAGFEPDEPAARHTKSRTLTITALAQYKAEMKGAAEVPSRLDPPLVRVGDGVSDADL
jgi:hypothetical protein